MTGPPGPLRDETNSGGGIQKSPRAEAWLLVVGVLILVALLGHLLNQQRTSRTPDINARERTQPEPASAPPELRPSEAPPRADVAAIKPKTAPSRVVHTVTHKHRLRDCHGTLTFTMDGLRFESDEPQDSFAVRRDDVTIEGDELRIQNKTWRFEFRDDVRAERIFQDWKSGTLRPVTTR
jgi:hypothetical protein